MGHKLPYSRKWEKLNVLALGQWPFLSKPMIARLALGRADGGMSIFQEFTK